MSKRNLTDKEVQEIKDQLEKLPWIAWLILAVALIGIIAQRLD